MSESIVTTLREFSDICYKLSDMWEGDNTEGIDLNDYNLDYEEGYDYPFEKSFDEVANAVSNWVNFLEDKIGSRKESFRRKKISEIKKPLKETWAGEDVINDLVDRAKSLIDDGDDLDEAVTSALDDGLIYTQDIRTLADHYDVLPDDSELVGLFYEELYNDVYNEASDYYDEVHEEDDEEENESLKSFRRKKISEARKPTRNFDFNKAGEELADIKEIYAEEGIEGVVDLPWKNIEYNYPEVAKIFKHFVSRVYDNEFTPEDCWDYMDQPLYDSVVEFINLKNPKQNPVGLIMKNDKDLDVKLQSDLDPLPDTPDENEVGEDEDYVFDLSDTDYLPPEDAEEMKQISNFMRRR